jgi:hypothetical protein
VTAALKDVPASCAKCHAATSKTMPPLAPLMHGVHLAKGDQSEFLKQFQGEFVVHRFDLPANLSVRLQVGFAALAMSIVAELLLAAALQGSSVAQYIASRDPVSGSVYLCVLLLFALMPSILARLNSGRAPSSHGPA